ncbi:MAG TPA: 3-carboxy-cis,cis-muconate cycloisomerase [Devosia sp.]
MRRPLIDAMLSDQAVDELLSDEAQLAAMLRVEVALAKAEAAVGLIPLPAAGAIESAARDFTPDWDALAAGMQRDGVVVPRLVAQLRRAVGAEHGEALHKGATSQDIIDTALMLQLQPVLELFGERLAAVLAALQALAATSGGAPLMAHTRMQAALPFTVGAKLRTWIEPLEQQQRALAAAGDLLAIQLGGPIGDRSSFDGKGDEIASHLARGLGLADAPCWHSSRSRIASLGSLLAQTTGTLGKLGSDIGLMAQSEVRAVRIEGGGSSSSMSHKANPVGAEHLVALAHHNAALAGTLFQAMVHENERSGAAWTLEWLTLPQMLRNTGGALRIAAALVSAIRF